MGIGWTRDFFQVMRSKLNLGLSMPKRYRGSAFGDKPIAQFLCGLLSSKTLDAENVSEVGDR
jgi:hypothetical protein